MVPTPTQLLTEYLSRLENLTPVELNQWTPPPVLLSVSWAHISPSDPDKQPKSRRRNTAYLQVPPPPILGPHGLSERITPEEQEVQPLYFQRDIEQAERLVVGRTSGSDLQVSHMAVSKKHAYITEDRQGEKYFVVDAGSTNGTFVDCIKLPPKVPYPLAVGSIVTFGAVSFAFFAPDAFKQLILSVAKRFPESRRGSESTAGLSGEYGLIGA